MVHRKFYICARVQCYDEIYHINFGVKQEFPALRKVVKTQVNKYDNFSRVFDIGNQLLTDVTRLSRYSVTMMNERQSLHHFQSIIVCPNFLLWLLKH